MTNLINSREHAAKFLYRATYGPKENDIESLLALGEDAWFEQQFNTPVSSHMSTLKQFSAVSYTGSGHEFTDEQRYSTWLSLSIAGEDQLRQRTAFALSQIFVVGQSGNTTYGRTAYYDTLLAHSFGNFRDLLAAVTLSPMMGRYLSLSGSRKFDAVKNAYPDENFAREVMQLFTIGLVSLNQKGQPKLDADGNTIATYTQNDVEELARVLTGWRVTTWDGPMTYLEKYHDYDEKVVMGHVFPAGQTIEEDLNQAMDMLFNHPNTPVFIAKLLIKRFTASNPTQGYVKRVASAFKDNGQGVRGDMKAVLKAIMLDWNVLAGLGDGAGLRGKKNKRRHFGKAKEPLIVLTNFCRGLNVYSRDPQRWWDVAYLRSGKMGQAPLNAPTVFNFYQPDYSPVGELSEKQLSAPEFELFTMENIINISNNLFNRIIKYAWRDENKTWEWDETNYYNLINQPDQYIELLNERFYGGLMSGNLKGYFNHLLEDMTGRGLSDEQKLKDTLFIVQCSPEFRCQG